MDRGTYVYTYDPILINKFRSSEYHNVMIPTGYEQNKLEFDTHNLFVLQQVAKNQVLFWQGDGDTCLFKRKQAGFLSSDRWLPLVFPAKFLFIKKQGFGKFQIM